MSHQVGHLPRKVVEKLAPYIVSDNLYVNEASDANRELGFW